MTKTLSLIATLCAACVLLAWLHASEREGNGGLKKWQKGQGWGWVWGRDDEIGALNEMSDASRLAALRLVKQGRVYDLGVVYDRTSYKWPGHSPGEIMSFRTPEGVKRQRDLPIADNASGTAWHSCALFINDNVATQIDGLCHATDYWERHGSFMPVHNYLLIHQGVHIGEFHYLDELARDRAYEFCYICTTNKIKGGTAGFAFVSDFVLRISDL
jgi:hypothetical protein